MESNKGSQLMQELGSLLEYYKILTGKTDLTVKQAVNLNIEFQKIISKEIK